MKKTVLISLLIALSASAWALDFFGIEHNGNTTDNIINLIYSLVEGDEGPIDEYYGRLQKTDPSLAAKLKVDDLKIPCSNCEGKGLLKTDVPCPACEGTGLVTDPQALGYLQHKFCSAIDDGDSDKSAWKKAKAAFDKRRAIVLSSERLFGTIIRKEGTGLLLSLQDRDEIVFVKALDMMFGREGTPINGYVWPDGTHTYQPDDREPVEIKRYTATLWID